MSCGSPSLSDVTYITNMPRHSAKKTQNQGSLPERRHNISSQSTKPRSHMIPARKPCSVWQAGNLGLIELWGRACRHDTPRPGTSKATGTPPSCGALIKTLTDLGPQSHHSMAPDCRGAGCSTKAWPTGGPK